MNCFGRTRSLRRCRRKVGRWPFCHHHRLQPVAVLGAVLSVVATAAGLYQDLLGPLILGSTAGLGMRRDVAAEVEEAQANGGGEAPGGGEQDTGVAAGEAAAGPAVAAASQAVRPPREGTCVFSEPDGRGATEAQGLVLDALRSGRMPILESLDRCRWRVSLRIEARTEEETVYGTSVLRNHGRVTLSATDLESGRNLLHRSSPMVTNSVQDRGIGQVAAVRRATEQLLEDVPDLAARLRGSR